ncbi:MAG: hypothetical protein C4545_03310 [Anaerolineaceae bacterium]|jgi:RNA polymerase-interacting CarD/CdnL/TRCF family regulator|nr:MAG: hypothetical protein C4545_03310 [Anaerolineaceae bacterium]
MDEHVENHYKKNDWIVHSYHGVSHIEGIDRKHLDGREQVFFKVKTTDLTYWLPVNATNAQHIRDIASVSTLEKALTVIRKKPRILGSDYRARKVAIQEGFMNGSLASKAELIRDLNGRVAQHRDNIYEEKMLDTLKQQFIDEWAIANDCSQREAQKLLNEALTVSESKLEPV